MHAHVPIAPGLVVGNVGVIVTETPAKELAPDTVITPVVFATFTAPANLDVVVDEQELKIVDVPVEETSDTQVRAELAARTTSETLAFCV